MQAWWWIPWLGTKFPKIAVYSVSSIEQGKSGHFYQSLDTAFHINCLPIICDPRVENVSDYHQHNKISTSTIIITQFIGTTIIIIMRWYLYIYLYLYTISVCLGDVIIFWKVCLYYSLQRGYYSIVDDDILRPQIRGRVTRKQQE